MRAYIFIDTKVGKTKDVSGALARFSSPLARVLAIDTVTGPHDIIAVVEGEDMAAIGQAIATEMHRIDGIVKTLSCAVLST